jgi:hypothetical protein
MHSLHFVFVLNSFSSLVLCYPAFRELELLELSEFDELLELLELDSELELVDELELDSELELVDELELERELELELLESTPP